MTALDGIKVEHGLSDYLRHGISLWDLVDKDSISSVTILLTYACPAACDHCVFESSPSRRETVNPETARRFVMAAARQDPPPSLSFSGGEAFLQLDLMRELTDLAASLGMASEVISSSGWATSDERATRVLRDLYARGMRTYCTSIDDLHAAFIDPRKMRRAVEAALGEGYTVVINSIIRSDTRGRETEHISKITGLPMETLGRCVVHPFITVPVGRARTNVNDYLYLNKDFQEGCPFSTEIVTLSPRGFTYPCCGMVIGEPTSRAGLFIQDNLDGKSVDEIAEVIEALKNDLFFKLLQTMGPYRLLQEIKKANPELDARDRFTGSCDVCLEFTANPAIAEATRRFLDKCQAALYPVT
ncbi:radical SAM protein [Blastococcus montanus]|uniref:radical SAM protein n=1 Tax=Blastococcus montanus TaxID=3144973 RepID=UPI00320B87C4